MNNNNIPFRYPDNLKKCFASLIKLAPYVKTKNQALKYALQFSAACIENILEKNPKMENWNLSLELRNLTGKHNNYFDFKPVNAQKKKVVH